MSVARCPTTSDARGRRAAHHRRSPCNRKRGTVSWLLRSAATPSTYDGPSVAAIPHPCVVVASPTDTVGPTGAACRAVVAGGIGWLSPRLASRADLLAPRLAIELTQLGRLTEHLTGLDPIDPGGPAVRTDEPVPGGATALGVARAALRDDRDARTTTARLVRLRSRNEALTVVTYIGLRDDGTNGRIGLAPEKQRPGKGHKRTSEEPHRERTYLRPDRRDKPRSLWPGATTSEASRTRGPMPMAAQERGPHR